MLLPTQRLQQEFLLPVLLIICLFLQHIPPQQRLYIMLTQIITVLLFLLTEVGVYFALQAIMQKRMTDGTTLLNPITLVIVFILSVFLLALMVFKSLPEHLKLDVARGFIYGMVLTLLGAIGFIVFHFFT